VGWRESGAGLDWNFLFGHDLSLVVSRADLAGGGVAVRVALYQSISSHLVIPNEVRDLQFVATT